VTQELPSTQSKQLKSLRVSLLSSLTSSPVGMHRFASRWKPWNLSQNCSWPFKQSLAPKPKNWNKRSRSNNRAT